MRAKFVCVLLGAWMTAGGAHAANVPSDRTIAKFAAIVATNRLAGDRDDKKGRLLLRLAAFLAPQDKNVLLTRGMLKRDITPDPIKTRMDEETLIAGICLRGRELIEEVYPTNVEAARLALAYFRTAEAFAPDRPDVVLGLMLLRVDGFKLKLNAALAQELDVAVAGLQRRDIPQWCCGGR